MEIVTGKTGTNHITSSDHRAFNAGILGTGSYVLDIGTKFAYRINSANSISITDGDLVHQGCHARIPYNEETELTIETGAVGYNRIDLIVAEYKLVDGIESMELKVIKGTPTTGTATEPSYTTGNILENDTVSDMPLYSVTISGVNISGVTSKFGVVTGLNDVYRKAYIDDLERVIKKMINDEISSRAAGDTSLSTAIATEKKDRQYADQSLTTSVNSVSSVANGAMGTASGAMGRIDNLNTYNGQARNSIIYIVDKLPATTTVAHLKERMRELCEVLATLTYNSSIL